MHKYGMSDDELENVLGGSWENATPEAKLIYFNEMAKRPCPPQSYWREILELANYFAQSSPK